MKRAYITLGIIFLVLLIDQSLKIYIKTHFAYGQEVQILGAEWARLHFIENDGMAFGMKLNGDYGKLALTLFRIIAVACIAFYLFSLIKQKTSLGLIAGISLIFAGAVGNIIDSMFYGLIFDKGMNPENPFLGYEGLAAFSSQGYASFLHGNVVDMFYFPIASGHYPDWLGGGYFEFFRPVFNVADSAISIGVLSILLFNREIFRETKKKPEAVTNTTDNSQQEETTA
jgi:signal peptidase II